VASFSFNGVQLPLWLVSLNKTVTKHH